MKEKTICPACGGPLILHRVGSYADDYRIDATGKISPRKKRRTIYPTDLDMSSLYCGKCYETYTDFCIDKNNKITLATQKNHKIKENMETTERRFPPERTNETMKDKNY